MTREFSRGYLLIRLLVGGYLALASADVTAADRFTPTDPDPLIEDSVRGNSAAVVMPRSPFVYPQSAVQIGSTWADMQQNGSMGRQIVVGGGWVHHSWYYIPMAAGADRNTSYAARQLGGAGSVAVAAIDPATAGGGFCAIDYDPTAGGAAAVAYHQLSGQITKVARDFTLAFGSFAIFGFTPAGVNCQGVLSGAGASEGPYFWPKIATDVNLSGQSIAHVVSTEYNAAEEKYSLVYYRSNSGITGPSGTCATWLDSVTVVGAVVVQDPSSNRVAVVYPRPTDWAHADAIQQRNNDVAYRVSANQGGSWGPIQFAVNYAGSDLERAYTDLSALYTYDGCLHVLWTAAYFDSALVKIGLQDARLYHWDDCSQCRTLLYDAHNSEPECRRGIWNKNISKMNLSACQVGTETRLYASYTRFLGDNAENEPWHDCSVAGFANGEIFAQVSVNNGATWGPPVNLTNTASDNCDAGDCLSEHWSSAAMYVSDSLRLQYILDRDPGAAVYSEGSWTFNAVMNLSYPCFGTVSYSNLDADPAEFRYPFHALPAATLDTFLIMSNSGNIAANYTRSVHNISGSGWLGFPYDPPAAAVPVGCIYFDTLLMRITAPAVEGFYQAEVSFTYFDGSANQILVVPVDLHVFNEFYLPQEAKLRTSVSRLIVNQAGRAANNRTGSQFTFFSNGLSYLRDASLILGTEATKLSWLIYEGMGANPGPGNPYGPLYALSNIVVDSTSFAAYRYAAGIGCNRDSTLAFRARYYAPKDAANSEYYLLRVDVFNGPKSQGIPIQNVCVAFAADWDLPAEDGFSNSSGGDDAHQFVYQRGSGGANNQRYALLGAIRVDGESAPGGFVWNNATTVVPSRTYRADSLWTAIDSTRKFEGTPEIGDLNSVVVAGRHESIGSAADTLKYVFVLGGQLSGSVNALGTLMDKARFFNCIYVSPEQLACPEFVCGDADANLAVSIADVVYLINYIFAGGPSPLPLLAGDVDCTNSVSIADAVYIINYIFGGGSAPCANCP